MEAWSNVKEFWEYLQFEEDGIGIKGIRADAPESAKKAYAEWAKQQEENNKLGIKV